MRTLIALALLTSLFMSWAFAQMENLNPSSTTTIMVGRTRTLLEERKTTSDSLAVTVTRGTNAKR
jgi:hypothetical protein